ncbi:hypothetical protein BCR35DRAFT_330495 [Leucosporidium creatinivorum]|uniref:Uncharacterized protein n=1 Tax=Leucosporidium creatinivorum TaxID=106004 RepID=A0A1Y2FXV3_9BASI|nr:hypothetical protein BCR35DRAFT_330495 [Leucosporidium creatinivorum]
MTTPPSSITATFLPKCRIQWSLSANSEQLSEVKVFVAANIKDIEQEIQANYLVMDIIIIAYLIAYLHLMYHCTFTFCPAPLASTFLGIGLQVLTFAFLNLSWTSRSSEE